MALNANCLANYDATDGSNTNGGFYKQTAGTTDYSKNAAAEWTGTNLSSDGAGTAITDADAQGLFTAQMVGNGIYLTGGTGFTTGYYEIVTFTDSDNIVIDRSAGASKTGGTGNVGGSWALPTTATMNAMASTLGQKFENNGTYTIAANILPTSAGSIQQQNQIRGYNTDDTVRTYGTDRPTIAMGAYTFDGPTTGYYRTYDLNITGSYAGLTWGQDRNDWIENVTVVNSSANAAAQCIRIGTESTIEGCAVSTPNATPNAGAFHITSGISSSIFNSYVYDTAGIGLLAATEVHISGCVFDNCGQGVWLTGDINRISYNTFYDCDDGVYLGAAGAGGNSTIHDNLFDSCTDGIGEAAAFTEGVSLFRNNWSNNGTDINATGVSKGVGATSTAPSFADAAGGDFTPTNIDPMVLLNGSSVYRGAVQASGVNGGVQVSYVG